MCVCVCVCKIAMWAKCAPSHRLRGRSRKVWIKDEVKKERLSANFFHFYLKLFNCIISVHFRYYPGRFICQY